MVERNSEYTKKMIQGFIKIEEDMLKIPGLSFQQVNDIKKLRQELDALSLQNNDAKVKGELIEFMNSMN